MNIIARNLIIKNTYRLTLNSFTNLLRNFLFNKRLSDLGLSKLQERHISINELDCLQKLNELSLKTIKELGKLHYVVYTSDLLSKEDLIYTLLRSINPNEDNYIKSITTYYDTNSLNNEIKANIEEIRQVITLLNNILSTKEKNKITNKLQDILRKIKKTRLRKNKKERILLRVIEIHNNLAKKSNLLISIMMIISIKELLTNHL